MKTHWARPPFFDKLAMFLSSCHAALGVYTLTNPIGGWHVAVDIAPAGARFIDAISSRGTERGGVEKTGVEVTAMLNENESVRGNESCEDERSTIKVT